MRKRTALSALKGFFDTLGSAIAVSAAIESHRAPNARDLHALGIEPSQFGKIRL